MRIIGGVLALIGLMAMPGTTLAEVRPCADPMLSVDAQSDHVAGLVCAAAMAARAVLASCGLEQRSPINISVVESAQHPSFGPCLAVFDQGTGCLAVTDLARQAALLPAGDARAALPPEVLFAATITHEMTHAVLQQAAGAVQVAATEQEFVAAAMEMESLAPEWRQMLLDAYPVDPLGSMGLVHLSIYGLEPRAFANNAWVLFHRPEMGCALVRRIAAGTFRFSRR